MTVTCANDLPERVKEIEAQGYYVALLDVVKPGKGKTRGYVMHCRKVPEKVVIEKQGEMF